jgi:glycosyltransferase A (GT-A) superfamily protein (DUF2064 family)
MTALAIFVKTPGLSPVKTRLAAGIGAEAAFDFYGLALAAVAEAVKRALPDLIPYWAVAEPEALADPRWSDFPTIGQGEGSLGDRLDHVYSGLLARHGAVLMIGADSPQLTPDLLLSAARLAEPFVMGRADDGGFWLFGGTAPIPRAVWAELPISTAETADALLHATLSFGDTAFVSSLVDVDEAKDLMPLAVALALLEAPTPAQMRLAEWLEARSGLVRPSGAADGPSLG